MKNSRYNNNKNIFDRITESLAFLQNVIPPFIVGIVAGGILLFRIGGRTGMITGISISCLGLIVGIFLALHIKRKYGSSYFMSRVYSSPELDEKKQIPAISASGVKQYDVFKLTKDINPQVTKGMQGVILEILSEKEYIVEFVREDGTNYEYEGTSTFIIDDSFIL